MSELDGRHIPVAVIGGGQAGLSMSWQLRQRGIDHVVLERHTLAHAWREQRWDTFCLVTPNWQCQLPGFPYQGTDPDGFMVKEEIVAYLQAYADSFDPPLHEGVTVHTVRRDEAGFALDTSRGLLTADQVVLAVGGYHVATLPRLAERLPDEIVQVHSSGYRNPDQLPPGAVLVVGSGQSGAQIAEDLHLAGRQVHLATGSAPRVARFYRGRDVVTWLHEMGYYDMTVAEHPLKEGVRRNANHYVTGRDGGRDINLRTFAEQGMHLYGRLEGVFGDTVSFGADLAAHLDRADEVCEGIKDTIDKYIATEGIDAPDEPRPIPRWRPSDDHPRFLDLNEAGITSVIWAMGFRSDFSWVQIPLFDGKGYPTHERGVTNEPGLFVLGLPWLHTWGSGRFSGVARDSEHLAGQIAQRARRPLRLVGNVLLDGSAFGS